MVFCEIHTSVDVAEGSPGFKRQLHFNENQGLTSVAKKCFMIILKQFIRLPDEVMTIVEANYMSSGTCILNSGSGEWLVNDVAAGGQQSGFASAPMPAGWAASQQSEGQLSASSEHSGHTSLNQMD